MGDTRAYPLNVLTRHDIADEKFRDIHVAGQDGLTCIIGNYADRKLEELNSTSTRWFDWYNSNPQSRFLDYP